MRVNIPEFHGDTLNPKGFIDCLVVVEEVFEFKEIDDQLVSCYIGGLRVQIMDSVNMFNPVTLSYAYQRALGGSSGSGNMASRFVPNQTRPGGGNTGPVSKGVGSSGLRCFNRGETGHRQSKSKKIGSLVIVEKINSNAYCLKLLSHIRCSDVFNVKHLLPYHGDSSDDDLVGNSRTNFVYPRGNDAGPSVEERALFFLEAQVRVKKRPLFKVA
ncbi:hypothetical protein Tco_1059745 [Tanacetum coccineum]